MDKEQGEEVDFETFKKMLFSSEIFLIDSQAKRSFDVVDMNQSGTLGMSEYENFLMAQDILGPASIDLMLLDVYDTLKQTPKTEEFGDLGDHEGMDFPTFCEAVEVFGIIYIITNLNTIFVHPSFIPFLYQVF